MAMTEKPPLIRAEGLNKSFGATHALRDFSLELYPGEVHALLGENGAGKSTFIKILAGVYKADSGRILIESAPGQDDIDSIAFIHQELGLAPTLSVADNFGLGVGYPRRYGLIRWRELRRMTRAALARSGSEANPETSIDALPVAERSLVAISRALSQRPQVLVLDEPTASLAAHDVERLFTSIRNLRDQGIGVLYVSHRLPEIRQIADRVTVIRDGRVIGVTTPAQATDQDLAEMIMGKKVGLGQHRPDTAAGETLLEVTGFSTARVEGVSFTLRHGEIVGLTGLRGAGHEVIGQALFGMLQGEPWTGTIKLAGRHYHPRSPREALAASVGYVTGDRSGGLAPNLTVTNNLLLNPAFSSVPGTIRWPRRDRALAARLIDTFHVQPPDPEKLTGELSGGNGQKVLLARSLDRQPQLLILEEPTAGVDVGTRSELYDMIARLAASGAGVLLISSDYEEIAATCQRVMVFERRRVSSTLTGNDISADRLTVAAMGADLN
jgi:ribose transport system ATP-binding protein